MPERAVSLSLSLCIRAGNARGLEGERGAFCAPERLRVGGEDALLQLLFGQRGYAGQPATKPSLQRDRLLELSERSRSIECSIRTDPLKKTLLFGCGKNEKKKRGRKRDAASRRVQKGLGERVEEWRERLFGVCRSLDEVSLQLDLERAERVRRRAALRDVDEVVLRREHEELERLQFEPKRALRRHVRAHQPPDETR